MSSSLDAAQKAAAEVKAKLIAAGQLSKDKPLTSDTENGVGVVTKFPRTTAGSAKSRLGFCHVEEVVINNVSMSARNYLTRTASQEEITKISGALVSTRGRYLTEEEIAKLPPDAPSNEKPLFLHIQGTKQQDVKVAVGRVMHIILEHEQNKSNGGLPHSKLNLKNGNKRNRLQNKSRFGPAKIEWTEKDAVSKSHLRKSVYDRLGPHIPGVPTLNPVHDVPGGTIHPPNNLLLNGPAPHQNMVHADPSVQSAGDTRVTILPPPVVPLSSQREKIFLPEVPGMAAEAVYSTLAGDNNSNLQYIIAESGVPIVLRGVGSPQPNAPPEALHFYLEHSDVERFNQAKTLVINLAQTIISDQQKKLQEAQKVQEHHLQLHQLARQQIQQLQQQQLQLVQQQVQDQQQRQPIQVSQEQIGQAQVQVQEQNHILHHVQTTAQGQQVHPQNQVQHQVQETLQHVQQPTQQVQVHQVQQIQQSIEQPQQHVVVQHQVAAGQTFVAHTPEGQPLQGEIVVHQIQLQQPLSANQTVAPSASNHPNDNVSSTLTLQEFTQEVQASGTIASVAQPAVTDAVQLVAPNHSSVANANIIISSAAATPVEQGSAATAVTVSNAYNTSVYHLTVPTSAQNAQPSLISAANVNARNFTSTSQLPPHASFPQASYTSHSQSSQSLYSTPQSHSYAPSSAPPYSHPVSYPPPTISSSSTSLPSSGATRAESSQVPVYPGVSPSVPNATLQSSSAHIPGVTPSSATSTTEVSPQPKGYGTPLLTPQLNAPPNSNSARETNFTVQSLAPSMSSASVQSNPSSITVPFFHMPPPPPPPPISSSTSQNHDNRQSLQNNNNQVREQPHNVFSVKKENVEYDTNHSETSTKDPSTNSSPPRESTESNVKKESEEPPLRSHIQECVEHLHQVQKNYRRQVSRPPLRQTPNVPQHFHNSEQQISRENQSHMLQHEHYGLHHHLETHQPQSAYSTQVDAQQQDAHQQQTFANQHGVQHHVNLQHSYTPQQDPQQHTNQEQAYSSQQGAQQHVYSSQQSSVDPQYPASAPPQQHYSDLHSTQQTTYSDQNSSQAQLQPSFGDQPPNHQQETSSYGNQPPQQPRYDGQHANQSEQQTSLGNQHPSQPQHQPYHHHEPEKALPPPLPQPSASHPTDQIRPHYKDTSHYAEGNGQQHPGTYSRSHDGNVPPPPYQNYPVENHQQQWKQDHNNFTRTAGNPVLPSEGTDTSSRPSLGPGGIAARAGPQRSQFDAGFCSDPSYDCSPQRSPLDYHSQQGPKTDQYYPGRPPHPTVQWRASSFQTGYESFGHPANRNAENPRPGGPVRVSENYDPSSRYAPGVQAPHGNANNNFRLASYPGQPSRFPQPGAPDTPAGQRGENQRPPGDMKSQQTVMDQSGESKGSNTAAGGNTNVASSNPPNAVSGVVDRGTSNIPAVRRYNNYPFGSVGPMKRKRF